MSEQSEVTGPILTALKQLGMAVWRNQSGRVRVRGGVMRLADAGTPDIVGFLDDGRFLGIECKNLDGKHPHTKEQWAFGMRLVAAGGVYILARNIDDVLHGLKAAARKGAA